ncbi:CDGSH iron-sulfur domain-containing protein 3 [Nibea albiflora]|uniref:CDGSH iron-sulfur domain-containing protein 3 n=1 Tax=Nibea albiflora TaxID=240163 RepID=A0ACB7FLY4_NIBAL|nr:CDGSH iron-sulfur domain-containing protein 3 [Nibea albiflora]
MNASSFLVALQRGCTQTFRRPHLVLPVSSSRVQCRLESTEVVAAARIPYRVKVTAGKRYAWCACGHSKKQPYCDGAHKAKAPSIAPLRFTPDSTKTVMLCACKETKNAPYCDGSHFKVIFRDLVKSVQLSTHPPKPVIPSKKPFKVELIGGKRYSWCTCGYSKKQVKHHHFVYMKYTSHILPDHVVIFQPFCDGAHKTKAQGLSPLRFVPEKDATVWLCGCKYTNNPPYCDGTHKQDFIVSATLHEHSDS